MGCALVARALVSGDRGMMTPRRPDGDEDAADRRDRLARLWWVGLPLVCRRLSASLTAYLLDGVWVFAFRQFAKVATPATFAVGLIFGVTTFGYDAAPFESILLVGAIVAVGTLGAHLGLAMVTGLAIGDFFLAGRDWVLDRPSFLGGTRSGGLFDDGLAGALARERVPLLIGYALLAFIAVGMPVLVKTMLAQLPIRDKEEGKTEEGDGDDSDGSDEEDADEPDRPNKRPGFVASTGVQIVMSVAGHAVLTYFLVSFWVDAAPVLLRPLWTWPLDQLESRDVSLALVQPLQRDGSIVLALAVMASLVRMGLQWHVRLDAARGARMSALQASLGRRFGSPRRSGKPRKLIRVAFRAAAGTLLLSGIVPTWADAVVLAGVLLVGGLFQSGIVPLPLGQWPATAQKIPLLFRIVGAVVFLRIFVQAIAERVVELRANTFRTFLVVSVLGVLVFLLLLPAPRGETAAQAER